MTGTEDITMAGNHDEERRVASAAGEAVATSTTAPMRPTTTTGNPKKSDTQRRNARRRATKKRMRCGAAVTVSAVAPAEGVAVSGVNLPPVGTASLATLTGSAPAPGPAGSNPTAPAPGLDFSTVAQAVAAFPGAVVTVVTPTATITVAPGGTSSVSAPATVTADSARIDTTSGSTPAPGSCSACGGPAQANAAAAAAPVAVAAPAPAPPTHTPTNLPSGSARPAAEGQAKVGKKKRKNNPWPKQRKARKARLERELLDGVVESLAGVALEKEKEKESDGDVWMEEEGDNAPDSLPIPEIETPVIEDEAGVVPVSLVTASGAEDLVSEDEGITMEEREDEKDEETVGLEVCLDHDPTELEDLVYRERDD